METNPYSLGEVKWRSTSLDSLSVLNQQAHSIVIYEQFF